MKRQNYYPGRIAAQVLWLENYANKLPLYAATLGLTNAQRDGSIADALWGAYTLGLWLPGVRAFSLSTTDAVDAVLTGEGLDPVALPTFTASALPSGTLPQAPGVLSRIFFLVGTIKHSPNYTEAMGQDLGIIGAEESGQHAVPKFNAEVQDGIGMQRVRLGFFKYTHMGVYIESRRNGGAWEFLGIDTASPYMDERPLLTPGTPETREYRMRFWDKGTPNGDWTDVAKVTVSP